MSDSNTSFNWLGLLQLFVLWLLVVFAALRVLDVLFPRLRRDDGEAPAATRQPLSIRPPRGATGKATQAAPALAQAPAPRTTRVGKAHWEAIRRIIGVMLLIWAGVSFVPAAFSPQLNRIQIFTGFPLGYY